MFKDKPVEKTKKTIIDILNQMAALDRTEWQAYLSKYKGKWEELLFQLVLNVDVKKVKETGIMKRQYDFPKLIAAEANVKLNELLGNLSVPEGGDPRAYIFCLLEVCERLRAKSEDVETRAAAVATFFGRSGYTKKERLQYYESYKEFICGDYKLNGLDAYLKDKGLTPFKSAMLRGNKLKSIHDFTKKIGLKLQVIEEQTAGMRA